VPADGPGTSGPFPVSGSALRGTANGHPPVVSPEVDSEVPPAEELVVDIDPAFRGGAFRAQRPGAILGLLAACFAVVVVCMAVSYAWDRHVAETRTIAHANASADTVAALAPAMTVGELTSALALWSETTRQGVAESSRIRAATIVRSAHARAALVRAALTQLRDGALLTPLEEGVLLQQIDKALGPMLAETPPLDTAALPAVRRGVLDRGTAAVLTLGRADAAPTELVEARTLAATLAAVAPPNERGPYLRAADALRDRLADIMRTVQSSGAGDTPSAASAARTSPLAGTAPRAASAVSLGVPLSHRQEFAAMAMRTVAGPGHAFSSLTLAGPEGTQLLVQGAQPSAVLLTLFLKADLLRQKLVGLGFTSVAAHGTDAPRAVRLTTGTATRVESLTLGASR
jgi:hypothetical protein